ncbi:MAG: hypothetical protein K6G90_07455, partial [Clostridia bacterium]|nr:hypothetical protein [Clostridia bacterium]
MQIAEIFFRQLKQKAQAILCVLTSIFVIDAGKRAGKMYAQELISAYLVFRFSRQLKPVRL